MAEVIVIGAGAAGIIAAWRAASLGAKVTLLEKTDRLGTKILISGGGKCNITHDGPIENVVKAFRPNESRFIRPSCYRFLNTEIIKMLTVRGLRVYTRPDGRIFPIDQTARDVVAILGSYLRDVGVEVRFNSPVDQIGTDESGVNTVVCKGLEIPCRKVILAVGGSSYPKTGTTGDGWAWAKKLGHTIVPLKAALAPIEAVAPKSLGGSWPYPAGVALRNVVVKARQSKEIARWQGDLLFTHHGVSGPCALGISRVIAEQMSAGPITIEVDLLPDDSFEQTQQAIQKWIEQNPKKLLGSFPVPGLSESLTPNFWTGCGIDITKRAVESPKKDRVRLQEGLKGWILGQVTRVPLEKGEVVAGGVSLDEVDPQTMRSKVCNGLYLCGEVLDIAGPVGGYNLQAAFATGFVAGETAARDELK